MTTPPGRRAAKKAVTRRTIQETALRLFLAHGYDNTTVERIATEAGVSHMTFFRHFPTKESVVDTDDHDPVIAELIRTRPADEPPLTAIHRAVTTGLSAILPTGHDILLERTRLILNTPALRARQADQQHATRTLFADALAARDDLPLPTFRHQVLAATALAALTTALTSWATDNGRPTLATLVDDAFAIVTTHPDRRTA